ncbi:hypothetical protein SAMN05660226_02238 [Parapedobacter luteus]|uniref:Uncharacterized protein n=1 Tax=Parapedobacter luteus TaxID=623280 RepID=A0A1T5CHW7_9SPHI|nr:hypothetical protein SAMN05660226_02238 [Parapedobacter luteus]
MLLERVAQYLDTRTEFAYIKDEPRLEIWVKGKEWLPILVSKLKGRGYLISWGDIEYKVSDEMKAYTYLLRMITNITER